MRFNIVIGKRNFKHLLDISSFVISYPSRFPFNFTQFDDIELDRRKLSFLLVLRIEPPYLSFLLYSNYFIYIYVIELRCHNSHALFHYAVLNGLTKHATNDPQTYSSHPPLKAPRTSTSLFPILIHEKPAAIKRQAKPAVASKRVCLASPVCRGLSANQSDYAESVEHDTYVISRYIAHGRWI